MKRIERLIKVLEDAERDFRKPPESDLENLSGLCRYMRVHILLVNFPSDTILEYFKMAMPNQYYGYYFLATDAQEEIWETPEKYNRANYCKKRASELKYWRMLSMKNKLERFLKDRRLYAEFCRAVMVGWGKTFEEYCEIDTVEDELILGAFDWHSSERGLLFWIEINDEWEKTS